MIYPWQAAQWQNTWHAKQDNRLPHALLLTGIPGMGKAQFAEHLTRALLCQQTTSDGSVCDSCHACRLISGKSHPNVLWIQPEKVGQAIKVDQVREVADFVNHSSLQGEFRVVIIDPANNMNINAANALLKTLEEPSSGALLILISHQDGSLPATIISRCQQINFPRPATAMALSWLKSETSAKINHELLLNLANGAPLAALQLCTNDVLPIRQELLKTLFQLSDRKSDPLQLAAKMTDIEPVQILDFTLSCLLDLMHLQLAGDEAVIINTDFAKELLQLKPRTKLQNNLKIMDYLQALRLKLASGINLNKQLMLENIFIHWRECT